MTQKDINRLIMLFKNVKRSAQASIDELENMRADDTPVVSEHSSQRPPFQYRSAIPNPDFMKPSRLNNRHSRRGRRY